jgi:hypothetical protein
LVRRHLQICADLSLYFAWHLGGSVSSALHRTTWAACFFACAGQAFAQYHASPPPMPIGPQVQSIAPMPVPTPMPSLNGPIFYSPSLSTMPTPPIPPRDWVNDPDLNAQYQKIIDLYLAGNYDEALPLADAFLSSITARYREDSSSYAVAISVLARLYQAQPFQGS